MSFKTGFKSPECQTVMDMRRQCIPESRSQHQETAVCTSQTGEVQPGAWWHWQSAVPCLAYSGWPWSSCRLVRHRCTGSCKGGASVCSRLAGGSAASAVPPMLEWHGQNGADPSLGGWHSSGPAAVPRVQQQTGPPTKSYSSQPKDSTALTQLSLSRKRLMLLMVRRWWNMVHLMLSIWPCMSLVESMMTPRLRREDTACTLIPPTVTASCSTR